MKENLTQEIIDTFIYETMNGSFGVIDPTASDEIVGIFGSREAAEKAFIDFVETQGIVFE